MIYRVAIAADPPEAIEVVGVVFQGREGARSLVEPPGLPRVEVSFQELSLGFVRTWVLGTRLSEWAALILMLNCLGLPEAHTPEEDRFLGALWDASAGEPISDDAVEIARKFSETES